eukprot:TRINITY_DN3788_c0_g1_i1.p1 TRINITY_DN3788_c0_g1~~TRINITY_DN3788_c0_g1_i1.p1  ORF type:complete len:216 (+),score=25.19 TRINITY_DN3788_c0_g1_i1:521-1168(+)
MKLLKAKVAALEKSVKAQKLDHSAALEKSVKALKLDHRKSEKQFDSKIDLLDKTKLSDVTGSRVVGLHVSLGDAVQSGRSGFYKYMGMKEGRPYYQSDGNNVLYFVDKWRISDKQSLWTTTCGVIADSVALYPLDITGTWTGYSGKRNGWVNLESNISIGSSHGTKCPEGHDLERSGYTRRKYGVEPTCVCGTRSTAFTCTQCHFFMCRDCVNFI